MLKNNYNFKLSNSINSNSKNILLYKNYLIQILFLAIKIFSKTFTVQIQFLLILIKLTYLLIDNKNIS